MPEQAPTHCRNCGKLLSDDPGYEDQGLCGDCYWDDQTNADGTINEDDSDDDN